MSSQLITKQKEISLFVEMEPIIYYSFDDQFEEITSEVAMFREGVEDVGTSSGVVWAFVEQGFYLSFASLWIKSEQG